MSEENEATPADEQDDATAPRTEPRGNPEVDQEAVDKGVDQLERVKPY